MSETTLEERILANARVDECMHPKDFLLTCEQLVEQGKLVRGPHWERRTCYRLAPPS